MTFSGLYTVFFSDENFRFLLISEKRIEMADSKEEIDEIFRFLAETALHERPCGENHTLSSFFLKLLEHNAPPKGFTKVVDLSDASYGDQIIKPYLEPLMKETKDSCPENIVIFKDCD